MNSANVINVRYCFLLFYCINYCNISYKKYYYFIRFVFLCKLCYNIFSCYNKQKFDPGYSGKKLMEVSVMTNERRQQLLDRCECGRTREIKRALKAEADPVVKKGLQETNRFLLRTNMVCILLSAIAVYMVFMGSMPVKILGIALVVIEFIWVHVLKAQHAEAIEYLRLEADEVDTDAD